MGVTERTVVAAKKIFDWSGKQAPHGTTFVSVNYVIVFFFLIFSTLKQMKNKSIRMLL